MMQLAGVDGHLTLAHKLSLSEYSPNLSQGSNMFATNICTKINFSMTGT